MSLRSVLIWGVVVIVLGAIALPRVDAQSPPSLNRLAGEVDLAHLIDLSVEKLDLNLQYDPTAIRGVRVTLRFRRAIDDRELWQLTSTLLASRGFAVVDIPGTDFLTIVKVQDAQGIARIEQSLPAAEREGFVRIMLEIHHRPPQQVIEAVRPLLSKPGGIISQVGATNLVLIADYAQRLDEIMTLLERLDVPPDEAAIEIMPVAHLAGNELSGLLNAAVNAYGNVSGLPLSGKTILLPRGDGILLIAPPAEVEHWRALIAQLDRPGGDALVETIPVTHLPASRLVTVVESASATMGAVSGATYTGKLIAMPGDDAIVLVSSPREVEHYRSLIERFDARQAVRTETYVPRFFAVDEVSALIEDTVRDEGPRGSGDQWRVVPDDLTGTLIVTATELEHARIAALFERLDAATISARQPLRSFPIRNRPVLELLDILVSLIEAGALEAAADPATPPAERRGERQQSRREVLPPGASDVTAPLPTGGQPVTPATGARPRGPGEELQLTLTADEGTNTLIALGDPRRLDQLDLLIQTLDVRQAQVLIEVLIISLTDGTTLDLGVELERLYVGGATMFNLASLFSLGTPGLAGDDLTATGGSVQILDPGDFRVLIRALETFNDGRAVNMPRVLVNNNQQAVLDSVLQQPFTSTNASNTVSTTSFGGTQDAGTSVTVTPQIAEGDHLVLEYAVSLSTFVGESADITIPPPRQQNTLESIVTIPDGHTVVLGGLETTSTGDAVSQVPLLGSLPLVGAAFRNRSTSNSKSRFFVFIRANVLRHKTFEDLKYLSGRDAAEAGVADDWPVMRPRIIR